ncbi:LamG-like jellyroll fold domain-containing protein [Paenibacillus sp. HW567]|uniref:LamG-like jellyroll fold domain-containing protein n=1 Tax=Paenibacillus sp. HW567 TaxID=1034769 RepID=UPI0003685520|nr:LamG-like jellyroll fold domain-containing protein [Paenibacillus sp. HW567]
MKKNIGKFTASLLALALVVPSTMISAAAPASDFKQLGQVAQKQVTDYTGHWAQKEFQTWADKGLISGYGNGVYKPDQDITRLEWVSLVNRVFHLQAEAEVNFTDVSASIASDIQKAAAAGYVSGYSDGTFRPDQTVSRQEAAVMLFRLFKLTAPAGGPSPKDAADLPSWSQEAVLSLFGEGYLGGYADGSFRGEKSVTRAEALRMIGSLAGEIANQSGTLTGVTARNMIISTSGVVLKDSKISGNLYLTEGIGEGDVTLDNVDVGGKVFVNGGGENSVTLNNTAIPELVVNKQNGKLRVLTQGTSTVNNVRVHSGVKLEEEASATGGGFGPVVVEGTLPAQSAVQFSGSFPSVDVRALGEPSLYLNKGSIAEMTMNQKAELHVEAGAEIKNLIANGSFVINVQGAGKVSYSDKYSNNIKFVTPGAAASPSPAATANTGSGGTSATPVATPAATPVESPAATPALTPTATPVATATPTATATPVPTPVPTPVSTAPAFTNVSVHDPSIVKDGSTYYVFGSHIDAAKSSDLMNWTRFTNGYTTPDNVLYGDLSKNLAESFAWAGENDSDSTNGFSVWAPDVFWNKDYKNADGTQGAYMLFYCTSSTYIRSAIGFAVSQKIEGPYTYGNTVIYSGFTLTEAYDAKSKINKQWENTNIPALIKDGTLEGMNPNWFDAAGAYKNKVYTNAIDPNVFYDKEGKLWMTYGSWSGGIFILEIDPVTGKPKYPGKDGTTADGRLIDRYFGTHISGGNTKSGEGPYVTYDKNTDYYYLYVTYGGLAADGGYSMRLFRSKNPDGPYKDAAGQDAAQPNQTNNAAYGNKLLGNFMFTNVNGDPNFQTYGYVSSGHNSVYYDAEKGKLFNFFHTRFPLRGESHELRVHQMFMNEDGWPVVAPHRYSGETIGKVQQKELAGAYQFINHGKDVTAKIKPTVDMELNEDGTVTGSVTGTWELKGDYYAHLLLDETVNGSKVQNLYKGVFVKLWDSTRQAKVMTFTAMSEQGVAVWGSQLESLSDEQLVANVAKGLTLGDTSKVYRSLTLPVEGVHGATITWSSSNNAVVGNDGKVTRPEHGSGNATVELTATVKLGAATAAKAFTVVVVEQSGSLLEDGLVAAYDFEDNLAEAGERAAKGEVTGNRANNTGGTINYEAGKDGKAARFDGSSGVRLPDGLIHGSEYTVSMWLRPDTLTPFTTAFFGAKSDANWISLLPYGNGGATTRLWFGSEAWLDADLGVQIGTGQWSHVAFTYDAGTVKMYLNGDLKSTGTGFTDVFSGEDGVFALGVNYWDVPYQGMIDKLRVYEKALSAEAVGWLVNGEPDTNVKVSSITFAAAQK